MYILYIYVEFINLCIYLFIGIFFVYVCNIYKIINII